MGKIERFEDLIAGQKARGLAAQIDGRITGAEFHQLLSTAKASCIEMRSQLHLARDMGYIDQAQFDHTPALAGEVKIIGGLRASLAPHK